MAQLRRLVFSRDDAEEAENRQTRSLAGLAVALLLVVASLYVLRQLAAEAAIEDCLLANRRICDVIVLHVR
jgi:hypothetical protein